MEYNDVLLALVFCLVVSFGFFISIYLTKENSLFDDVDRYVDVSEDRHSSSLQDENESKGWMTYFWFLSLTSISNKRITIKIFIFHLVTRY